MAIGFQSFVAMAIAFLIRTSTVCFVLCPCVSILAQQYIQAVRFPNVGRVRSHLLITLSVNAVPHQFPVYCLSIVLCGHEINGNATANTFIVLYTILLLQTFTTFHHDIYSMCIWPDYKRCCVRVVGQHHIYDEVQLLAFLSITWYVRHSSTTIHRDFPLIFDDDTFSCGIEQRWWIIQF